MKALILAPLLLLAGCDTYYDRSIVDGPVPLPQQTGVGIGQTVFATPTVAATPVRVVEDSRCPVDARCTWAGRLVVETRFDGVGWAQNVTMILGEPAWVQDRWITLVAASPAPTAGRQIAPAAYRFTFAG